MALLVHLRVFVILVEYLYTFSGQAPAEAVGFSVRNKPNGCTPYLRNRSGIWFLRPRIWS